MANDPRKQYHDNDVDEDDDNIDDKKDDDFEISIMIRFANYVAPREDEGIESRPPKPRITPYHGGAGFQINPNLEPYRTMGGE